ncbi:MAG: phosphatidylserine decarboxylase [Acidobacteriota bacterium]|jgi:phosphatidylserine decarboxylase|nr:phosphatidylserine decarboxylase [Acidobacteriota bacterium]
MARDGYRFVLPLVVLIGAAALLHLPVVTALLIVLAAFIVFFFRNPSRAIPGDGPDGRHLVVSPADGKVVKISQAPDGEQTLCIFLNIFNVHVTRAPIAGTVERFEYKRGRFKVAFDEEASRVNEQNIVTFAGDGVSLVVKQVAGLIARRVVCWKKPGDAVERGQLFGLIRFGSRVDVVMPAQVGIRVKVGDKVRGGSSIIGDYP